jgi:hypothetical protein
MRSPSFWDAVASAWLFASIAALSSFLRTASSSRAASSIAAFSAASI